MNERLLRRIETNDETLKGVRVSFMRELRQFIAAVPDNSNIQALEIRGVIMDLVTASDPILPRMPSLRKIIMHTCDCSNATVLSILASALANNRDSLEYLSLRRCRIGNRGAEIIVSSLGSNSTLKKISLAGNSIGDEGAIDLASFLSSNSSVDCVNLMVNRIRKDGMLALAASLCENRSVEVIDLRGNTDEPSSHIKRALYNDASIESVIASNHILKSYSPASEDIRRLLELNEAGPEKAVRAKIIRFLNEQPTYALTMGIEGNLLPSYMSKIGRDCQLNTMFELICSMPDLIDSRKSPLTDSTARGPGAIHK